MMRVMTPKVTPTITEALGLVSTELLATTGVMVPGGCWSEKSDYEAR